jgi:myo-inositol-1(or 4)-monophosphatase
MAAGLILVREAGGLADSIQADGDILFDGEIICANENLYENLIETIRNPAG